MFLTILLLFALKSNLLQIVHNLWQIIHDRKQPKLLCTGEKSCRRKFVCVGRKLACVVHLKYKNIFV
jgi:hypothetical protein